MWKKYEIDSYVDQEAFYQNCKCHDPLGRLETSVLQPGHFGHILKMHYFFTSEFTCA